MNIFYLRQKFKSEKNLVLGNVGRDEGHLISEEMAYDLIFEKSKRIGQVKDLIIYEKQQQAGLMKVRNMINAEKNDLQTDFKLIISEHNENLGNLRKKNDFVLQYIKITIKLI